MDASISLIRELLAFLNKSGLPGFIKEKLEKLQHKEDSILRNLHYEFSENINLLEEYNSNFDKNKKDKQKFKDLANALSIEILDGIFFNNQKNENEAAKYRRAYDKMEKSQQSKSDFIYLIERTKENVSKLKKDSNDSSYTENFEKKRITTRTNTLLAQFTQLKNIVEANLK